jgi:hypothetical protein
MIIPLSPIFSANSMYAGGQPKLKDLALINFVYHDRRALVSARRAKRIGLSATGPGLPRTARLGYAGACGRYDIIR